MHWKFLRAGSRSPFTGFDWRDRGWVTAEGTSPCQVGIHACRLADLPYWLADELWQVELAPPVVAAEHKVVAMRARLVDRVVAWTPQTSRALSEACAHRVVGHAAGELRGIGRDSQADRLAAQPLGGVASAAKEIMEDLRDGSTRSATRLCGYVVDAVEAIDEYPVATVAYIAARAANERTGPPDAEYYTAERAWQAEWLATQLHLGSTG